jgi:two-component system, cell cycle sensor histidine kinase and response regulator CckA
VSKPYRILLVEDSEADAVLLQRTLERSGFNGSFERVETRESYIDALQREVWDAILADCSLPVFSADEALQILNERRLDIPVIIVSGKVDETDAIPLLRAGAEHFISKDDLGRVPVSLERAVVAVHRRREAALELGKHRDHLEELVAERTEELETANARLQVEIDERGRIEGALQKSELQYRDLVESAFDGICIIQDQKIQFSNQRLAEMLGYDVDDIVDTSFTEYLAPERIERVVGLYRSILKGEEDKLLFQTVLLTKRGRRLETGVSVSAIDYHGSRVVMVTLRDISEQEQARRIALENERLEAVGIVARGVGNNFTNIMSVISSYAASIADGFLPDTRPHNAARKILDASRHASDLTKRLLSVVRVDEPKAESTVEPVALAQVIDKARSLVGHSLSARGVKVVIKKPDQLPNVMADESQLLDTLMNLFLNAGDAMPDGGTLRLACIERHIAKPRTNPSAGGGQFVGLSIQDTGVGMAKEQVSRVFEPFFTTKDSEEAFGLGLPVAQSMAQSWGGWIDIRSRLGKGTRVRIFMAKAESPVSSDEPVAAGPLTVLVTDDNPGRRELMVTALEQRGHRVLAATTADEALQLHQQHAAEIDISVIDWIMPEKSGKIVLQAIFAHDPQAKVIMTSGFSRDYVRSAIRTGAWGFLQKPFSGEELVEAVEAGALKNA